MKHELPTIPPGHDFARDSFWWRYRERFYRARRVKETAWEWYFREKQRAENNGMQFPPEPVFQKATRPMPQPWTGIEEKAGRVPREGK